MKTFSSFFLAVAAIVVAAAASAPSARADLYVVESTVAAIKAGSRLADADTINIPSGGYIRAVLPSGKTQTIRGPYDGSVANLSKGQARNEGVMAWIKSILETGGSREQTPGATRGAAPPSAGMPRTGFSWSAVPVALDGPVCVEKGASLTLVRAPSSRADSVTIVDVASSERAEAQWEAGKAVTSWPAGLTPRTDAKYYMLVPDRPRRQVILRIMPQLPDEAEMLNELHRLGCKYQFQTWVQERMAASKRGS